MGETALKVLLSVLPTVILLSAVIMALMETNWDVEAAVFGNMPEIMKNIAVDVREDAFRVKDISFSGDRIEVTVEFTSPFSFPVKVKDLTFDVASGGEVTALRLENEVLVPPNEVKEIKLSGKAIVPSEKVAITNFRMVTEFYGITLEVTQQ